MQIFLQFGARTNPFGISVLLTPQLTVSGLVAAGGYGSFLVDARMTAPDLKKKGGCNLENDVKMIHDYHPVI